MTAAGTLILFLTACALGTIVSLRRQRSPLIWIILGCIVLDIFGLWFVFNAGILR